MARELKIAYNDLYIQPLPEGHRYPMKKYELLPKQLLYDGTIEENNFFTPGAVSKEDILSVHDEDYYNRLTHLEIDHKEQRRTGFIHNKRLIEREHIVVEGTRKGAEFAFKNGIALNISGGTHHAFTDRGEGFCMLNDQAIAAKWLLKNNFSKKILIIDLDVHQGNGTAEIFRDTSEVFTFSMHGKKNFPFVKEISDFDVELQDGIEDKEYLYLLEQSLDTILEQFTPDFIFYQAGVDIIETDKLGRLHVSIPGCKKRDEIVLNLAKGIKAPIFVTMGGGYSKEIKYIVEAHANTFRVAQSIFF